MQLIATDIATLPRLHEGTHCLISVGRSTDDNIVTVPDVVTRVLNAVLPVKPVGTGLGLAICREIVQHYHGRIWAESRLGEGSAFHIELPPTVFATS